MVSVLDFVSFCCFPVLFIPYTSGAQFFCLIGQAGSAQSIHGLDPASGLDLAPKTGAVGPHLAMWRSERQIPQEGGWLGPVGQKGDMAWP